VKAVYQQAARDDLVRHFRYSLLAVNVPEVAVRFRTAVRLTLQMLLRHPQVGARYPSSNPHLQSLRTWAVTGFESVRIYYLLDGDTIRVVRMLHGKRDVKQILETAGGE
jgi:plasmid stabilization system protein ParE